MFRQIYKKWFLSKYPQAAEYKWQKNNAKITDRFVSIFGKQIALKYFPAVALNTLQKYLNVKFFSKKLSHDLAPYDYWYATNASLRRELEDIYNNNISLISDKDIIENCQTLFKSKSFINKAKVLTLLKSIELLHLGGV